MPTEVELLSRDDFRELTFRRDNYHCVVPGCNQEAVDAHHLIERRLWADEGYYLANGGSVCAKHHLECEATIISCEDMRRWCGIQTIISPPNIDQPTDKWGNPLLDNGKRSIGPLFFDPSVQKVLGNLVHDGTFVQRIKYGRTAHVPWSPGVTRTHGELDDEVLESAPWLYNEEVVITEKLDGENTTMYYGEGNVHARSLDGRSHPSRSLVKAIHARIAYDIPPGMRVVGENMQAVHSIKYNNVPPFLVFAILEVSPETHLWTYLSWDETKEWCSLLELPIVPELYRGPWKEQVIRKLLDATPTDPTTPSFFGPEREGYVVRTPGRFSEQHINQHLGKWVRAHHVRSNVHWMHKQIEENGLQINV